MLIDQRLLLTPLDSFAYLETPIIFTFVIKISSHEKQINLIESEALTALPYYVEIFPCSENGLCVLAEKHWNQFCSHCVSLLPIVS